MSLLSLLQQGGAMSSRTGCLLQTLPSGPAACPFPGQGGDEAQPRGPGPRGSWPTAGQGLCVLGGAGGSPVLQLLLPGGAGAAISPLSRDFSTQGAAPQKGHNPQEPLRAASSSYSFVPET